MSFKGNGCTGAQCSKGNVLYYNYWQSFHFLTGFHIYYCPILFFPFFHVALALNIKRQPEPAIVTSFHNFFDIIVFIMLIENKSLCTSKISVVPFYSSLLLFFFFPVDSMVDGEAFFGNQFSFNQSQINRITVNLSIKSIKSLFR